MNETIDAWDTRIVIQLNKITRERKFDWNQIVIELKSFVTTNFPDTSLDITPATCRAQFSKHNEVVEPAPSVIPKGMSIDELSKLSLEELVEYVDKKEQSMKLRKEEIFQKILTSLNVDKESITIPFEDTATSAFHAAMREKEEKIKQRELKILEAKEKERLEKERESLKRRFDADSEHAVGIYPEFLKDTPPVENANNFTMPEFKEVQLDHVLGGDEFDLLLNELERELDSQAGGKDEGEVTELGEIIQFLEKSAYAQPQTMTTTSTTSSGAAKLKNGDEMPLEGIPRTTTKNTGSKSLSTSSPNDTSSAPSSPIRTTNPPASSSAAAASPAVSLPKVPVHPTVAAAVAAGKGAPSRRAMDYHESSDEDDNDDDDLNWRNRRQNMKKFSTALDQQQQQQQPSPTKDEVAVTTATDSVPAEQEESEDSDEDDDDDDEPERESNSVSSSSPIKAVVQEVQHSIASATTTKVPTTPTPSPVKNTPVSTTVSSTSPIKSPSKHTTAYAEEMHVQDISVDDIPIEILDIPETTSLLSGSLLSSTASNRRTSRGKTGPLSSTMRKGQQ